MKQVNKNYGITNIRNTFLFEAGIGVLANTILLLFHILKFFQEHKPRPTNVVIGLLALTHIGNLTIMGFISTDVFKYQKTWTDIKCKSVIYLQRFFRGLSICATCLLSVLQAVTLSPSSSCLAKFKHKSTSSSLCSLLVLWVFYMSLSAHFSISSTASGNVTSHNLTFVTESCIVLPTSYFLRHVFTILGILRDVSLIGLMALASAYMVLFLLRHKRNCRHLHSTRRSVQASPEQRATQTILLLLSCFMVMYFLDCIFSSSRTTWNSYPVFQFIQIMVANGYATISPFLFLSTEKRLAHFSQSLWRRTVNVSL